MRERFKINSVWLFTDLHGNKLTFESMNEIILERLDMLKDSDTDNILGLKDCAISKDFSINCSFQRGSSITAQLRNIPEDIIELANRWKKFERAKGRKARFSMLKTYADIEMLLPKMIQYSAML